MRAKGPGAARLAACLESLVREAGGEQLSMVALLSRLVETGSVVDVITIQRDWADVDEVEDVVRAAVE